MTWPDLAAATADAVASAFGEAATWLAGGVGPGIPITVTRVVEDPTFALGPGSVRARGERLEVRASEVAAPAAGDRIVLASGAVRQVQGALERDAEGVTWILDTRAVS